MGGLSNLDAEVMKKKSVRVLVSEIAVSNPAQGMCAVCDVKCCFRCYNIMDTLDVSNIAHLRIHRLMRNKIKNIISYSSLS